MSALRSGDAQMLGHVLMLVLVILVAGGLATVSSEPDREPETGKSTEANPENHLLMEAKFQNDPAEFERALLELNSGAGASEELIEGVTVAELAGLKTMPDECTRSEIFRRWYLCDMVRHSKHVNRYCLRQLDTATRFCANKLLGQDPKEFNCIQRMLNKPKRAKAMNKNDQRFWLELIDNQNLKRTERFLDHLDFRLISDGSSAGSGADSRLLYHFFPAERLTKRQLLARINEGGFSDKDVGVHLSQTKNKAATELFPGVTVADLLVMNDASHKHCKFKEVRRRHEQCLKTGAMPRIRKYCRAFIERFAKLCSMDFSISDDPMDPWWIGVHWIAFPKEADYLKQLTDGAKTRFETYFEKDPNIGREENEHYLKPGFVLIEPDDDDDEQSAGQEGAAKESAE